MRKRPAALVFFMVLAMLLPTVALADAGHPFGNTHTLWAQLSGAAESAVSNADAMGFAKISIDPTTGELCFRLSVANIAPASAAHIHAGGAGVSGPVVVPLAAPDAEGLVNGCKMIDPALAAAILANPSGYYVNVHNAEYPGGVVRGQLMPFGEQGQMDGQRRPTMAVVAAGLANPRGVEIGPDGVYVAQAGRGSASCIDIPDPRGAFKLCFGNSGAVTRIAADGAITQVGGPLSSYADNPDGFFAAGPHDVAFDSAGNLYVIIGLGTSPANRDSLGALGAPFGRLYKLSASGVWSEVADIAAYEAAHNPDGGQIDSNPYSIAVAGDKVLVVDAGGNDLLAVSPSGAISTVAVFPSEMVEAPPELGMPEGTMLPMQAVPTSVAVGPDGAWYVGQLTGFPFPVGGAKIWRLADANGDGDALDKGEMSIYAKGLTAVVGISFDTHGNLFAVEIAKYGLHGAEVAAPDNVTAVTGAVIEISASGDQTEIASDGLILPGGVAAAKDGTLYVSNFSVFPNMGEVVHITP